MLRSGARIIDKTWPADDETDAILQHVVVVVRHCPDGRATEARVRMSEVIEVGRKPSAAP